MNFIVNNIAMIVLIAYVVAIVIIKHNSKTL